MRQNLMSPLVATASLWAVLGCIDGTAEVAATTSKPTVAPETQESADRAADEFDYQPKVVLRKPIRPIVEAEFVTADKAEVTDNELIIGVEVEGIARAYPINQLTGPQREIINDTVGNTPIAATW